MLEIDDSKKIISSFYIVGCDLLNLQKYIEENKKDSSSKYIQNIDLLITDFYPNQNKIEKNNEKWIKMIRGSNTWFRIQYSEEYNSPITELKIVECNIDKDSILFPKNNLNKGYRPIIISKLFKKDNNRINNENIIPISKEFSEIINYNENYVKIPINLNAKNYLELSGKKPCAVIAITRTNIFYPFKDIYIQSNNENNLFKFLFYKYQSHSSYKYLPQNTARRRSCISSP